MEHVNFVLKLYRRQVQEGRVFLHEHSAHAKSWMLKQVQKLAREEGVMIVEADQCMYGLKTRGHTRSQLVAAKKPTKIMTNSKALGKELSRKCNGRHDHQSLVDGRAAEAARYPTGLCRAICRGIIQEKKERHCQIRAVAQIPRYYNPKNIDLEELHDREEASGTRASLVRDVFPLRRLVEKGTGRTRYRRSWPGMTSQVWS